jgi:hypothetical protein
VLASHGLGLRQQCQFSTLAFLFKISFLGKELIKRLFFLCGKIFDFVIASEAFKYHIFILVA